VINLPNLISLLRLAVAPLAVYLVLNQVWAASFWLFVAAGLSDALDGYLARRLGARTLIGGYLDPLADKAMLLGVFVTLGWLGHLPEWLVILVCFREVVIVGGALLVHTVTGRLVMQPLMVSKINTVVQFLLAATVLCRFGYGLYWADATNLLIVVVAATTLASGAAYVAAWSHRVADFEEQP
jgi:cardiolipin synthase